MQFVTFSMINGVPSEFPANESTAVQPDTARCSIVIIDGDYCQRVQAIKERLAKRRCGHFGWTEFNGRKLQWRRGHIVFSPANKVIVDRSQLRNTGSPDHVLVEISDRYNNSSCDVCIRRCSALRLWPMPVFRLPKRWRDNGYTAPKLPLVRW